MTQLLVDRILLSGTQREIEEYEKLCNCTDADWFFESHSKVLRGRGSDFHPMKSVAYLKAHSSNWRKRHKTTEWWQWLEDFRPDAGLEKHRFLFDPMANVFDCKGKTFVHSVLDWQKKKEHRYYEYWLDRPLDEEGRCVCDRVTRGRLIAYRFPHLAFRDYLFYRFNYMLEKDGGPFAMVPDEILLNMMGLNWQGQMVSTGFYDKKLNNVARRSEETGKVVKKDMGHNQSKTYIRPMEIDHKDRDKFNDLPCNIRWVDRTMNLQNRGGRARP